MFYQDRNLFVSQSNVDACVENLAYTLGFPRVLLNVVCLRVDCLWH